MELSTPSSPPTTTTTSTKLNNIIINHDSNNNSNNTNCHIDNSSNIISDSSLPTATLASSSSSSSSSASCAGARYSSWFFAALAISVALTIYMTVTRFLFPLLVTSSKDHNNNNNNSNITTTNKLTLILILSLCCFASTVVPGTFNLSLIAAGYTLGFELALVVVLPSVFIGITIAFLIGRTICRERAAAVVAQKFPSAKALIAEQPTKAIWLSWLLPVPLSVKIFLWASCTSVGLVRFLASAAVIAVPQMSVLVFVGDEASAALESGKSVYEKALGVIGVASVFVAGFLLSRYAQKSVAATTAAAAADENA